MQQAIDRRQFMLTSAALAGAFLVDGKGQTEPDPQGLICPKSRPPAKTVFATNLGELTSYPWDWRLTLSCLQGVVNRSQPCLYLIHDRYDELWLDWMVKRGDVEKVQWLEVAEVFERFLPKVSRMYVTDPEIPATVNVATMLAGLNSGLVVTPAVAASFDLPTGGYPDLASDGLDLRTMHWKKDADAYRWAFGQFGDQLSRQAVAVVDPQEVAARDYLIEFKIPILWVSGLLDVPKNPQASPEEEKVFSREILMKWPPNIPCFGWPGTDPQTPGIGEDGGVDLASECAKFWICTTYDGYSPTVGNISVHSGTTATFRQPIPPVKLQRDKVYFAFVRTDGDGMNFIRHYYRVLFDDPVHGEVPMGWQLGPASTDLIPDIVDYYYKRARPGDCFNNALTGAGYIHEAKYAENYPAEQRRRIREDFVKLSSLYRQRIDASVLNTYAEMSPGLLESFAGMSGVQGVFANYIRTHETTLDNIASEVGGKPVFRAVNGRANWLFRNLTYTSESRRQTEAFMVGEIKRWTPRPRPAFLYVSLANWLRRMDMAVNIAKGLGPEYIAVRPDQLVSLYRQSQAGEGQSDYKEKS
jgi:hypothetical protein